MSSWACGHEHVDMGMWACGHVGMRACGHGARGHGHGHGHRMNKHYHRCARMGTAVLAAHFIRHTSNGTSHGAKNMRHGLSHVGMRHGLWQEHAPWAVACGHVRLWQHATTRSSCAVVGVSQREHALPCPCQLLLRRDCGETDWLAGRKAPDHACRSKPARHRDIDGACGTREADGRWNGALRH